MYLKRQVKGNPFTCLLQMIRALCAMQSARIVVSAPRGGIGTFFRLSFATWRLAALVAAEAPDNDDRNQDNDPSAAVSAENIVVFT